MSDFNLKKYFKKQYLTESKPINESHLDLKIGNTYSVYEPGMGEWLDGMEFLGYDRNNREYIFRDTTWAPGSIDVVFMHLPESEASDSISDVY